MAVVFYPSFDAIRIDANGFTLPLASATLNVLNVTDGTSEGTVASNANGIVPEGSKTAAVGDVIEISHATYPLTCRFTLTTTQAEAYTHPDNGVVTYIAENLYASVTAADFAEVWATDNDNPSVKPFKLADAKSGLNLIPFQSAIQRNFTLSLVTHDETGQTSTRDLSVAESVNVTISAVTAGPRCIFDHFTDAPTTGTTLETLYIDQIDAGQLAVNGDKITAEYSGVFAANTNEKVIVVNFAGAEIFNSTDFAPITDNGTHWTLEFVLTRVSNTVVRVTTELIIVSAPPFVNYTEVTALNLTTTDYDLEFTAQTPTAPGDLTAKMAYGLFIPAATRNTADVTFFGEAVTFGGDEVTFVGV